MMSASPPIIRGVARRTLGLALLIVAVAAGCSTTADSRTRRSESGSTGAADAGRKRRPPPPPSPQSDAASALVRQARKLYRNAQYDQALNKLTQATGVYPRSGESHYWLAAVWLAKGNRDQAREHHRFARRYLGGQARWAERLKRQAKAIGSAP